MTSRTAVGIEPPRRVERIEDGWDEIGKITGHEPVGPA
jgi:hypothetical protein